MRVLNVVLTPVHTRESGAIRAGTEMARHVARHADVDLAIMARRDAVERLGPRLRRLECRSRTLHETPLRLPRALATPLTWTSLPRWIDPARYDVVHVHNPHPTFSLVQVARRCVRRGVPWVFSSHGFVEFATWERAYGLGAARRLLFRRLLRPMFRYGVTRADRILVTSPQDTGLVRELGVPEERIRLVTNGVDPDFLEPPEKDRIEAVRARWGLDPERPSLLFLGNLTANKGVDVLLRALPAVRTPVQAVVVGQRADEGYGRRIEALAREAGHPVRFCGRVPREDLKPLLAGCDLFVFPSLADTLPLSILEAMALARPVIASDVGGIPYEVTPETGWLFEPGAPAALAARIEEALADPERRIERGRRGQERVRAHFTWERAAEKALAAYREVAGRNGRG